MTTRLPRYCPKCQSVKQMVKAGFNYRKSGGKQQWKCRNKICGYITVNPVVGGQGL